MKICAIGDIHGCREELDELMPDILEWFGQEGGKIIFLGDLIDRGPDVRGVLDRVRHWSHPNIEVVVLLGNHEQMMLSYILDHSDYYLRTWFNKDSGGIETIESLGDDIHDYAQWLREIGKWTHVEDGNLFVHAGIDPRVPISDQSHRTFAWIRKPFLHHEGEFENGYYVVHGHTPSYEPEIKDNRLNLDTGCVFGGPLSAGLFENGVFKGVIQAGARF